MLSAYVGSNPTTLIMKDCEIVFKWRTGETTIFKCEEHIAFSVFKIVDLIASDLAGTEIS